MPSQSGQDRHRIRKRLRGIGGNDVLFHEMLGGALEAAGVAATERPGWL